MKRSFRRYSTPALKSHSSFDLGTNGASAASVSSNSIIESPKLLLSVHRTASDAVTRFDPSTAIANSTFSMARLPSSDGIAGFRADSVFWGETNHEAIDEKRRQS